MLASTLATLSLAALREQFTSSMETMNRQRARITMSDRQIYQLVENHRRLSAEIRRRSIEKLAREDPNNNNPRYDRLREIIKRTKK